MPAIESTSFSRHFTAQKLSAAGALLACGIALPSAFFAGRQAWMADSDAQDARTRLEQVQELVKTVSKQAEEAHRSGEAARAQLDETIQINKTIERQAAASERASNAAERLVSAANNQLQSAINANASRLRPRLTVTDVENVRVLTNAILSFDLKLSNKGQTDPESVMFWWDYALVNTGEIYNVDNYDCDKPTKQVYYRPQLNMFSGDKLSEGEVLDFKKGLKRISVYGLFCYTDDFNRTYSAQFCFDLRKDGSQLCALSERKGNVN